MEIQRNKAISYAASVLMKTLLEQEYREVVSKERNEYWDKKLKEAVL